MINIEVLELLEDIGGQIPGVILHSKDEDNRLYGMPGIFKIILQTQYGILSFKKYENMPVVVRDMNGENHRVTVIGTLKLLNQIVSTLSYLPFADYYGT